MLDKRQIEKWDCPKDFGMFSVSLWQGWRCFGIGRGKQSAVVPVAKEERL
jgi:hypothetical protein